MKNEKLKATSVRFTDSDLHLIDRLQEKLGLGLIHVIPLAIRPLAESENLLPLPSTPKNLSPRLRWLLARLWQEWKQAETISLIPAQGSMRVMAISQQQVPSGESKMEKHVRGYHQR